MRTIATIAAAVLLINISVSAGGFQINEHSARAMMLGGAYTAMYDEPSAIYFNPGALAQMSGFKLQVGTTLIAPAASFRGPAPSITEHEMESAVFTPSHFYASYEIADGFVAGLGFNNPFGLATKWNNDWVGRFVSRETALEAFTFQPTVAYKLTECLSIGGGLTYSLATVKIERASNLSPVDAEVDVVLDGETSKAFGFHAGLLYILNENTSFGLTYRSEVDYDFEGTIRTTGPDALASSYPNGAIYAGLTTPQQIIFGAAHKPMSELLLSFDFQYIMWSSYDKLAAYDAETYVAILSVPKDFEDTFIARLGAEYVLNDMFTVGGGILYDRNPAPDETVDSSLPDSDRIGLSIGGNIQLAENIHLDVSYLFLRFNERTITNSEVDYSGTEGLVPFNGTWNSTANLFSLSMNFGF